MLHLTRTLPRATTFLRASLDVMKQPAPAAYLSSSSRRYASTEEGNNPRFQEKDQVQAEQQAKDPKKMANLGEEENKKRDDPHKTSGDVSTPGVKGKTTQDEPIGRNINNKASG